MTAGILTIVTPSGTVRATAQVRGEDTVLYALTGALRGFVHVTGTHHPRRWDQFTALRVSLGSVNAMDAIAPAESLPRRRGSSTGYTGGLVRWTDDDYPYQHATTTLLESTAGNAPSAATGETLVWVMRACAEEVARRPDLHRLLDASRKRETPGLLRFLDWSMRRGEAEAAGFERKAQALRRDARTAVSSWWTAARWLTARPHPVLALVLMDYRGSLARRADYLPAHAEYTERAAREERDRVGRIRTEIASLRAQQRPHKQSRRSAVPRRGVRE
ncbi:hypothetical protein SAMN05216489_00004 [Streptomyces sp. 3213]|uniref:hypothetical protein n=1 Tax=Streptomyces sp. 3213.3 TaxID=1855348 RepID=UPI000897BE41|nr:hypothetical protein [Streptomyces sp. 3213.3]SEC14660.1 hypothetical protein SAMN05216489_00004 [Streptomyces sp. 3213] [Streptomyces sp. 3213.3]